MNPDEIKVAIAILSVLIVGSGWILGLTVKHHFQTREREALRQAERELASSRSRDPQRPEIFQWPSRSHGAPGEWGGPTEVLSRIQSEIAHPN